MTTTLTTGAEATLALAQRFLKAVNDKDIEAVLETVSDDVYYTLHAAPAPTLHGHDGLRTALAALVATWPDYDFEIHSIRAEENLFVAEWTMTGTLSLPMPIGSRVAVPNGRSGIFKGVDICPVSNGKITGKISYVDATAWYEQYTFEG